MESKGGCLICLLILLLGDPALGERSSEKAPGPINLGSDMENHLTIKVPQYDSGGTSLVENLLNLAYQYQLPLGLEYVDREAVQKPVQLRLNRKTLREVLFALVARFPEYRIEFSKGTVQVFSPTARADHSNLLNVLVNDFQVQDADIQEASNAVFEALVKKEAPGTSIVESTALDTLHRTKVTLHVRNAKLYEILDLIVATQHGAIWTVRVPPNRLSSLGSTLWSVYCCDLHFKNAALQNVPSLFPRTNAIPAVR